MRLLINRLRAVLAAGIMLFCGCAAVPDREISTAGVSEEASQAADNESTEAAQPDVEEIPTKQYTVEAAEYSAKLDAESGAFEGEALTDGEYDGEGYISLSGGAKAQYIISADASQHYCIAVAARAESDAAISLKAFNETVGVYYIPVGGSDFSLYAVDSVYLAEGPNIIALEADDGSAEIDYIAVTSSAAVDSSCYDVSEGCACGEASVSTLGLMKYLRDSYGQATLTGQSVTPGTNAEIEAVQNETGRIPAIRTGDLMYSSAAAYEENKETADNEVELALQWGRGGGIVSFNWHWIAPTGEASYYAEAADFSVEKLSLDTEKLAQLDTDAINALAEGGEVTAETAALIADIDAVAQVLRQFRAEDIPVIFQPLPDGDGGLYWWCGDAESYKQLWQLMFERLSVYHSLNNLIWVWNGSSADYFPGEDYCDIIGQSFYENSSSPFAGRFSALAEITDTPKMLAITACDKLPSPDYMKRDNAVWLWFSIGSGECIINAAGELSEKYTSWQSLHDAYNGEACITLDELPNFQEYAFNS